MGYIKFEKSKMNNEKVLNKIKKLFALANNNSNENESLQAMKAAKKLLDRHNLTEYDLHETIQVGIKIEDNPNMPYVRTIYNAITQLYDCKYLKQKQGSITKHLIIGTEANRVTTSIIIAFVLDQLKEKTKGKGSGFRNAAALGVYGKVLDLLEERSRDTEEIIPGTGLVPLDATKKAKFDNQKWIDEMMGKITKGKPSNHSFNSKGIEVGRSINLNVQLSNARALNSN